MSFNGLELLVHADLEYLVAPLIKNQLGFDVVMFYTSVILSINAQRLNIKAIHSFGKNLL